MPDEANSQRSVLAILGERIGLAPKVLLSDSASEHGASPVVDPASAASKLVPQGRGNYQLLGEIARGGMGVILKGHDTDLGRDVAVKVLDGELAKQPDVVQRFVEEAQIGGQLQHPGIVPVYELGLMADDRPYFTMKLVKGRTLAALFQQRKTPADNRGRLLAIFESVCQTMAYAHSKGVLHRDLKPANVMVGAFGEVQVVDWGLAKVMRRGGVADEKRAKDSLLTVIETVRSGSGSGSDSMAGSVMGTPAYMAPEQAQGEVEKLDERADVFSLGAILCELLTGRPPYEGVDGKRPLAQAAQARLGPARSRLESCDADRALVQLCLDCMMTVREARPANADEVAKAVHAYVTSTEERAQKAELAAIEARVKADEERRRRRLTVALGGTVVAALALGVGGFYWVNRERARRAEQTRVAVEAAHDQSIEFGRAGKPEQALDAARRALVLAETGDADAALIERARNFVAKAEQDVGAADRERALVARDHELREKLIQLRLEQISTIGDPRREVELDAAFSEAFRDFGVDLEGDDFVPAMQRIRERDIAQEVALALDDWCRIRRRVQGANSKRAENLYLLSMDLDPDPVRQRMREAIATNDLDTMLQLSAPENLSKLEPGSIWVLSAALWDGFPEHRPDVYRMYDQAVHLYPGDYVLQSVGGRIYGIAARHEAALACRIAALSVRPHDVSARMGAAEALFFLGRLTESLGAYRACVAADPANAMAHYGQGWCLVQLGDYAGALKCFTRSLEVENNSTRWPDHLSMRFVLGLATQDEVKRAAADETVPDSLLTYLYPLLDHPDPKQRDPQFVLQLLRERASTLGDVDWLWVTETVAKIRLGDWKGAHESIRGHFTPPAGLVVTPNAFDFMRSLIHSKLGETEAARECYARGIVEWNARAGGDPSAWAHSDVMRWRREAEAALPN